VLVVVRGARAFLPLTPFPPPLSTEKMRGWEGGREAGNKGERQESHTMEKKQDKNLSRNQGIKKIENLRCVAVPLLLLLLLLLLCFHTNQAGIITFTTY